MTSVDCVDRERPALMEGITPVRYEFIFSANLVFTIFTIYHKKKVKEAAEMTKRALNFKMDEADIMEIKEVAGVFRLSMTDLVTNAVKAYIDELKQDPLYRLTANIQEASTEESKEILAEIENMSDDDLSIAATKRFSV